MSKQPETPIAGDAFEMEVLDKVTAWRQQHSGRAEWLVLLAASPSGTDAGSSGSVGEGLPQPFVCASSSALEGLLVSQPAPTKRRSKHPKSGKAQSGEPAAAAATNLHQQQQRQQQQQPALSRVAAEALLEAAAAEEKSRSTVALRPVAAAPHPTPAPALLQHLLLLLSWLPLLVSTSLQGLGKDPPFALLVCGLAVPFGLALMQVALTFILSQTRCIKAWPRLWDVSQCIVFGVLLLVSFVDPRYRVPLRWMHFIAMASLSGAALLSVALLQPAAGPYLTDHPPPLRALPSPSPSSPSTPSSRSSTTSSPSSRSSSPSSLRAAAFRSAMLLTGGWAGGLLLAALSILTQLLGSCNATSRVPLSYGVPFALHAIMLTLTTQAQLAQRTATGALPAAAADLGKQVRGPFSAPGLVDEALQAMSAMDGSHVAWPVAAMFVATTHLISCCVPGAGPSLLPYALLGAIFFATRYTNQQLQDAALSIASALSVLAVGVADALRGAAGAATSGGGIDTGEGGPDKGGPGEGGGSGEFKRRAGGGQGGGGGGEGGKGNSGASGEIAAGFGAGGKGVGGEGEGKGAGGGAKESMGGGANKGAASMEEEEGGKGEAVSPERSPRSGRGEEAEGRGGANF